MAPAQERIVARALHAGASLAALADATSLRAKGALPEGWLKRQAFPVRSILVLGLAHPPDTPELDWWGGPGGTEGNRQLIRVVQRLRGWLRKNHGARAQDIPYGIESGGIRLKDAAALAGLGTIGRNNLLVSPHHGPRIRLRAMALDVALEPQGPAAEAARPESARAEDPCAGCEAPCLSACPQGAFATGRYDRTRCAAQMAWDEAHPVPAPEPAPRATPRTRLAYCRACELACPVGAIRTAPAP